MPIVDAVVECAIHDSFRVQQVGGMFDLPLPERARERFSVDVPSSDEGWSIGAIVGPSGSGKTTIARKAFGGQLYEGSNWATDRAVIECFGDLPIKTITLGLTAVGFSSPPAWVKPYHVLSNGEKFRCELARSLLDDRELVVFDEFTSVVDRTVAKIASAAVAKGIRTRKIDKRFVAVTCHYDVIEWLTPDWVVDMATCQLARGSLRRPGITVEIFRCRRDAWKLFAKHHYLTASLNPASECYLGTWEGTAVGFVAVVPMMGKRNFRRILRVVVLPDFQGIGFGGGMLDAVCDLYQQRRIRIGITTSHPGMIRHLKGSGRWKATSVRKTGSRPARNLPHRPKSSFGRSVVSFRYLGCDRAHEGGECGGRS